MVALSPLPPVGDPFWGMIVRDAARWGMNARDVAAILMSESQIDPAQVNAIGAAGLNQITDPKNYAPLTRAEYLALSAAAQWDAGARDFLDGQLRQHPSVKVALSPARDLYWLNFLPDSYIPGAPDSYLIAASALDGTGGFYIRSKDGQSIPFEKLIAQNRLFATTEGDQLVIRAGSLSKAMAANFGGQRWKNALSALRAEDPAGELAWNPPGGGSGGRGGIVQPPGPPALPRAAEASFAGPAVVLGLFGLWAWARSRRRR